MRLRSSGASGLLGGLEKKRGPSALEKAERRSWGGRFSYKEVGLQFSSDHKGGGLRVLKEVPAGTEVAVAYGDLVPYAEDDSHFYVYGSKCAPAARKNRGKSRLRQALSGARTCGFSSRRSAPAGEGS